MNIPKFNDFSDCADWVSQMYPVERDDCLSLSIRIFLEMSSESESIADLSESAILLGQLVDAGVAVDKATDAVVAAYKVRISTNSMGSDK